MAACIQHTGTPVTRAVTGTGSPTRMWHRCPRRLWYTRRTRAMARTKAPTTACAAACRIRICRTTAGNCRQAPGSCRSCRIGWSHATLKAKQAVGPCFTGTSSYKTNSKCGRLRSWAGKVVKRHYDRDKAQAAVQAGAASRRCSKPALGASSLPGGGRE